MRIHIIGTSGSGKTTLAHQLAKRLTIAHIELDTFRWQPNWQRTSEEMLCHLVYNALQRESWVIDGDYQCTRHLIWRRVQKVVWLDYPAPLLCWRLACRQIRYIMEQKNLWGTGNCESWQSLLSRRSILMRALSKHMWWRRRYERLLHNPEFSNIEFVRLHSPHATAQWLQSFAGEQAFTWS